MRRPALTPATLTAAAPDLGLGVVFLLAWLAPFRLGPTVLAHLSLIMVLEFIIVHSSAFIGNVMTSSAARRTKLVGMLGLGAFYTIFVAAFSAAFHTAWPLVSFWLLMLNRLLGVLIGQAPEGEERQFVQRSWAASVVFYLAGAMLTVFLPIPRLGLTAAVLADQSQFGSGLWIEQPHRLVAFGLFYFTAVGFSELYGHRWVGNRSSAREAEVLASVGSELKAVIRGDRGDRAA